MARFDPALASGIVSTASALGMNPLDLATIISYETAGTFNPSQPGPKTKKWGQHRGLIQFGEPQARQFGVDWSNPLGSQLGPDGAVAKYFKASGYKPGMGLLDAYSTVNAGAPGLYNRSDAAAGGAPGTVRDKVENQMGGHRRNAERLLGSGPTNPAGRLGGDSMVARDHSAEVAAQTNTPVFGSMSPSGVDNTMTASTGPGGAGMSAEEAAAIGGLINGDEGGLTGLGKGLAMMGRGLDAAMPDPPRGGGMPMPRADPQAGNMLMSVLNQPTVDQMFLKRRLGFLG